MSSNDDYIRVSARVRNTRSTDEKVIYANEPTSTISFRINKDEKLFSFDSVFSELSSQESVFIQVGKRIIDGCLDGYNGTIFAYGQTGSGKTYTMFGPQNEDGSFKKNLQGLIPRCMDYLFEKLNSEQQEHAERFSFTVNCSFVQLYNEGLFDLLDNIEERLRIRNNTKNEVFIDGAVVEQVVSSYEITELLRIGFKNRRVAETSMNRESSRSHAIFIVDITTQNVSNGVINSKSARLNLVDLAGSERQSDSQTTGNHLKEATYINKSLSVLTRVIRTLSKNPNQYPGYRDSQLTRLLQDSLGGNTRSSVIINLHPNIQHMDTTASTLYFSDALKRIKNKATVNENVAGENVEAFRKEILRLKETIDSLKGSEKRVIELEQELSNTKETLSDKDELIAKLELSRSIKDFDIDTKSPIKSKKIKFDIESGDNKNNNENINDFVLHSDETNNASETLREKFTEIEQRNLIVEKRLIEAEKLYNDYKSLLHKRDSSIEEYEHCLAYKAKRLDNIRGVLDEMQKKVLTLEEENESLKKQVEFQQILFEKEKIDLIKNAEAGSQNEILELKSKLEEMEKQSFGNQELRKEAEEKLANLTGHHNAKQKINYVNNLREKISTLELENAKLLQEQASFMSTSGNDTSLRKRPVLRSRRNSQQPSAKKLAVKKNSTANILN